MYEIKTGYIHAEAHHKDKCAPQVLRFTVWKNQQFLQIIDEVNIRERLFRIRDNSNGSGIVDNMKSSTNAFI